MADRVDALVVGAGFSGLYMLHRLRDHLGLTARVLEAGGGIGGTWYWNRYPGARSDSESLIYQYSFSRSLQLGWEWSERYPSQPEILRYLNYVTDELDLRRDIHLNTRVTEATYHSPTRRWRIATEDGERIEAQFLITALGLLSAPNVPDFPGSSSFGGDRHFTGRWPHEGVDFTGQDVGFIGTGSSGIQAIPVIAEQADSVTVFQRTANFSVPARNRALTVEDHEYVRANVEEIWKLARSSAGGFPYERINRSALDDSSEERKARYDRLWSEGGLRFLFGSYRDLLTSAEANATAADYIRQRIAEIVEDPGTARLLMPTDHPYGTKRPPIDTGYYETYNRENVSLVDVRATPIERLTREGLRTAEREHVLDSVVLATGFDAITGPLLKIDLRGRGGYPLRDKWLEGPSTALGLMTAEFPNLFMISGPGSAGLTNAPILIEQNVDWIARCIEDMGSRGCETIEPMQETEAWWTEHIREKADQTLFPQANSWFVGANVPGKPRQFMIYAGSFAQYAAVCSRVADEGYEGFLLR